MEVSRQLGLVYSSSSRCRWPLYKPMCQCTSLLLVAGVRINCSYRSNFREENNSTQEMRMKCTFVNFFPILVMLFKIKLVFLLTNLTI